MKKIIIATTFLMCVLGFALLQSPISAYAETPTFYEVTFEGVANKIYITEGGTTSPIKSPTKDGYNFIGWKYSKDGIEKLVSDISTFIFSKETLGNVTSVYFTAAFEPNTFTLSFDIPELKMTIAGEKTTIKGEKTSESILYDQVISSGDYDAPTLEHYSFEGWYLDESLETPFTETTVTGDIKLYAKYQRNDVQVTFIYGEKLNVIDDVFCASGSIPAAPQDIPNTDKKKFLRWDKEINAASEGDTYTAVYVNIYSITVDAPAFVTIDCPNECGCTEEVTIKVMLMAGTTLTGFTVNEDSVLNYINSDENGLCYSFTMPSDDVSIVITAQNSGFGENTIFQDTDTAISGVEKNSETTESSTNKLSVSEIIATVLALSLIAFAVIYMVITKFKKSLSLKEYNS